MDAPFPVRLQVNPNNPGSTKNFELAISRCSGDVIALSDQDDVWQKDKPVGSLFATFRATPSSASN